MSVQRKENVNNRLFFDIERALDEDHILHADVKTSRCTQLYVSNNFCEVLVWNNAANICYWGMVNFKTKNLMSLEYFWALKMSKASLTYNTIFSTSLICFNETEKKTYKDIFFVKEMYKNGYEPNYTKVIRLWIMWWNKEMLSWHRWEYFGI